MIDKYPGMKNPLTIYCPKFLGKRYKGKRVLQAVELSSSSPVLHMDDTDGSKGASK